MLVRAPELGEFAATHGLAMIFVADLVQYRLRNEILMEPGVETRMPTEHGDSTAVGIVTPFPALSTLPLMQRVRGATPVLTVSVRNVSRVTSARQVAVTSDLSWPSRWSGTSMRATAW